MLSVTEHAREKSYGLDSSHFFLLFVGFYKVKRPRSFKSAQSLEFECILTRMQLHSQVWIEPFEFLNVVRK